MQQLFEIPVPPSANRMYRTWRGQTPAPSEEYENFIAALQRCVRRQAVRQQPTPCRFSMGIAGGKGWREISDIDNRVKPVLDALQKVGVLENDNVMHVPQEEALYRPRRRRDDVVRCFVWLSELEPTWLDELELPEPLPAGVVHYDKGRKKERQRRRARQARAVDAARDQVARADAARRRRRNTARQRRARRARSDSDS